MEYADSNVDDAMGQIRRVMLKTAVEWADTLPPRMRQLASWTDRGGKDSLTGKTARESLEAEAGLLSDGKTIIVVARSTRQSKRPWKGWNGAPVGAFLELSTGTQHRTTKPDKYGRTRTYSIRGMRAYPTIRPTIEQGAHDLQDRLQRAIDNI